MNGEDITQKVNMAPSSSNLSPAQKLELWEEVHVELIADKLSGGDPEQREAIVSMMRPTFHLHRSAVFVRVITGGVPLPTDMVGDLANTPPGAEIEVGHG